MISFPWDSIITSMDEETGYPVLDRAYTSAQWWDIYQTFFSTGVFMTDEGAFGVTAYEGNSVLVAPGRCNIRGTFGKESSERVLMLTEGSTKDRIDTVVLRWNSSLEARSIDLYIKQGKAQDKPVRPNLTRTQDIYELGLCDIFVPALATTSADERITDTRLETDRCGVVNPFNTIDTTSFFQELDAKIESMKDFMNKNANEAMKNLDEQTKKAVDLAQSAIDGTTAGKLQSEIDAIDDYTTGLNLIPGTQYFKLGSGEQSLVGEYYTRLTVVPSAYGFYDGFRLSSKRCFVKKDDENRFDELVIYPNCNYYNSNISPSFKTNGEKTFTVSLEFMVHDAEALEEEGADLKVFAYNHAYLEDGKIVLNRWQMSKSISEEFGNLESGKWYKLVRIVELSEYLGEDDEFSIYLMNNSTTTSVSLRKIMIQKGEIKNPIWSDSPNECETDPGHNMLVLSRLMPSSSGGNLILSSDEFGMAQMYGYYNRGGFTVTSTRSTQADGAAQLFATATKTANDSDTTTYILGMSIETIPNRSVITASFEVSFADKENNFDVIAEVGFVAKQKYSSSWGSDDLSPDKLGIDMDNIEPGKWYKCSYQMLIARSDDTEEDVERIYPVLLLSAVGSNGTISFRKPQIIEGWHRNPSWTDNPLDSSMEYGYPYNDDKIVKMEEDYGIYDSAQLWSSLPAGRYYLSKKVLNNQPTTAGVLENIRPGNTSQTVYQKLTTGGTEWIRNMSYSINADKEITESDTGWRKIITNAYTFKSYFTVSSFTLTLSNLASGGTKTWDENFHSKSDYDDKAWYPIAVTAVDCNNSQLNIYRFIVSGTGDDRSLKVGVRNTSSSTMASAQVKAYVLSVRNEFQ